jgi:hypothetical protein
MRPNLIAENLKDGESLLFGPALAGRDFLRLALMLMRSLSIELKSVSALCFLTQN